MKKLLLFLMFCSLGISAQTIESVSPNTGNAGETLQITITGNGTNFSEISGVWMGAQWPSTPINFPITALDIVSDTQIDMMVFIPYGAATGVYDISLYGDMEYYDLPDVFSVTNNNNTINGKIRLDANGNGCDAYDNALAQLKVRLNDGSTDSYTFTDSGGNYSFMRPAGTYTIAPLPELPYFVSSPPSAEITFPTTGSATQTQDFCLVADDVHNNLNLSLYPIVPARPGFDAQYRIVYRNGGNQPIGGTVNFTYDDSRLDLVSTSVVPASQTLNNLSWNYTNLLPYESRAIDIVLNVNSPMETPAVNIGDVLNFVAVVNPVAGDENPDNNTKNFNQSVVGSYDPNDKAVAEGAQVHIDNAGEDLHYVIRFQNTGNFLAQNIRVLDMLSPKLDKTTLQVESSSHPYRTTLSGDKLEFFFDNIMLPPEGQNEPGSHGFIAFRIKPVNTVAIGTIIENTAEIYFDYNFPIITNTVSTTFTTLGNPGFGANDAISLYPNPVGGVLNIQSEGAIQTIRIFNQLGQLVKADSGNLTQIAVGDLQPGTYFVKIASDRGSATKKLIKL